MTTRSALRRPGRLPGPSLGRRVAALAAATLVLGQLLATIPAQAAEPRAGSAPVADPAGLGELRPGVQYEEAMAHAADKIDFAPGGRVTVGYRPRAGDAWEVGGRAPRALPAGSASGRELRAPAPAPAAPDAPADSAPAEPAEPAPTVDVAPEASNAPAEASNSPVDTPVDAPTEDPSAVPAADGASLRGPAATGGVALDGTRLRKQVMGFLPYWEVSGAVLDYELLSTIAYFSVGSDKNGNLLKLDPDGTPTTGWGGWTSSRMTSIINAAHTKGTRVVLTLSVFAWTSGQAANQGALLGNPTARLNLAKQAAAAVRARGADGINLDFEPIASGYAEEFTAFVRTMRAELDKQAPGYQLTFDTTGFIGNYPIEAATAPGGADAIFIMGYDYRTAGSTYAGSIDPLSGPAYDLEDTINAYAARVSPSKLILGVPWYGRAWSTVSDQVNAKNQSGTKYGSSVTVVLDQALDVSKQYGRRWDSREQSTWVAYQRENCSSTYGCVTSWRQLYFDDGPAVKARYDMINRRGLRGAGIWALGYDADRIEMRQALAEKFLDDKTAPLAGIKALAPSQTGEAFTVAWKGADESGISDYDVQVSIHGGPWIDWLTKTTATSAQYQGAAGYGFAFRVRARDTHGNASAWDVSTVYRSHLSLGVGEFGKVVSSVNLRATPDTAGTLVLTVGAGTLLNITGGPVAADGYTWYEVTAPVSEWAPVGGVQRGVWAAFSSSSSTLVQLAVPPNTTHVDAAIPKAAGARFVPIAPTRFVDTRSGFGIGGALPSGAARTATLAGRLGVPSNAVAVTGTVTVVAPTSPGYLSFGPSAATVGQTSTINTPKGDNRASGFTIRLGNGGTAAALWTGSGGSSAHLIIDVTGYYVGGDVGATFKPMSPARVLDTRTGAGLSGSFVTGTPRMFAVAGSGGVPVGATAVTGNLVAVTPGSSGYLAIGPSVASYPATSSLNVLKGDTRAAAVTVKLDGSGRLGVAWRGSPGARTHVIFDVTGYFVSGAGGAAYYPLDAARVLDSRFGNGLSGPFGAKVARTLIATGRGTVPFDALAITGGVTVVLPTGSGWVTVGPSTGSLATTSTINVPKGDIRANGFTTRTGAGGTVGLVYNGPSGTSSNVILDVTGYFR